VETDVVINLNVRNINHGNMRTAAGTKIRDASNGWLNVDTKTLNIAGMTVYIREKNNGTAVQCHKFNFAIYSDSISNCAGKTMTYYVTGTSNLWVNQQLKDGTFVSTWVQSGVETDVVINLNVRNINHGI